MIANLIGCLFALLIIDGWIRFLDMKTYPYHSTGIVGIIVEILFVFLAATWTIGLILSIEVLKRRKADSHD